MKYSIAIWVVLVSLLIAWLLAEHRQMSVLLDSCHKQQERTQADIEALAQHRMEIDSRLSWFDSAMNIGAER